MVNYPHSSLGISREPPLSQQQERSSAERPPADDRASSAALQLLLFVDQRPSAQEHVRRICDRLHQLRQTHAFDLQVVEVSEHPYLAEHFKLVATPALIKLHPLPQQGLKGTNLVAQLEKYWPQWQEEVASLARSGKLPEQHFDSFAYSTEVLRLSDEIFRLKQEKAKMESQLDFKDRLISMLAHDLRNPLTAISIALETLDSGYDPEKGFLAQMKPALVVQLFKQARAQARNIERMIADVLQAGRQENVRFCLQFQRVSLEDLCFEEIEHVQPRCQEKNQQIVADIPNDLPCVCADPDRVRQVLANLLDNAIKYTPPGGTIHLSALHRTTQKVQVSVRDDGPGIPEENQEHVFKERFRLQRDRAKDGYGIGLSLCQKIVLAHYGKIWVESEGAGRGSCFHFTLPVFRL